MKERERRIKQMLMHDHSNLMRYIFNAPLLVRLLKVKFIHTHTHTTPKKKRKSNILLMDLPTTYTQTRMFTMIMIIQ